MNDTEKAIHHLTMLRRLDSGEKKKLYDTAIQALEKQIPKKPIKQHSSCGIEMGKCPSCDNYVDGLKNPFYCTNMYCLQKLDWSVEE